MHALEVWSLHLAECSGDVIPLQPVSGTRFFLGLILHRMEAHMLFVLSWASGERHSYHKLQSL